MKELLKSNRNFRFFWLSSCLASLGDYVDDIAFAQLVYLVTESTLLTSYVFVIKIIFTFASIFTATYIDCHKKKPILFITSSGQCIILLLLLAIYMLGALNVWVLMAFTTIQTVFSTFNSPAQNGMISQIVSKEEIVNARSTINIFMQFIQIFSYACAGALIATVGIKGAIILDIMIFALSSVWVCFINEPPLNKQGFDSKNEFFSNVREGFQFVLQKKNIVCVLIVTFLANTIVAPIDTLTPAYFAQGKFPSYSYAVFMIGIAIGGIIGTWMLTKLQKKYTNEKLFAFGFLLGAIGLLIMYVPIFILVVISSLFVGASFGFVSVLNSTLIQLATPKDKMARVFSIFKCVSFVASPLGIFVVGLLGESIDMSVILGTLGVLMLLTSLLSLKIVKQNSGHLE